MAAGALSDLRARTTAMLERVAVEVHATAGDDGTQRIRDALTHALAFRDAALDDHDTRLFHPARTIRVLIADAGCTNVDALAAAAFVDTIDPALVPEPPPPLIDFVQQVPAAEPGADDELLEALVTADPDVALVALAERLDHLRHLHLRTDLDACALHAQARAVYVPAARRFSDALARRLERWTDAFERRLILPG